MMTNIFLYVAVIFIIIILMSAIQNPQRIRTRRYFPAGPFLEGERTRFNYRYPHCSADGARTSADGSHGCGDPGCYFSR